MSRFGVHIGLYGPNPHSAPSSQPISPVPADSRDDFLPCCPRPGAGGPLPLLQPSAWQPEQTVCAICLCKTRGLLLTEIEIPSARSLCWSAERPPECAPNDTV